jgi:hypothetical protein
MFIRQRPTHFAAAGDGNKAITPRGLVIAGQANGLCATDESRQLRSLPFNTSGGMQRALAN